MSLDAEQREILNLVDHYCKDLKEKRVWNKFKGDVVCRIIQEYIKRHLPSRSLRVVGPNVFLDNFPNEFDLFIVDVNAKPRVLTSSFDPECVHCVLEVKKGGVFSPKDPEKISNIFNKVVSKYSHIKCAYLTGEEVHTIRRNESKNFYNICKEKLCSHGFFALRDLRGNKELISGEWEKFLNFILK